MDERFMNSENNKTWKNHIIIIMKTPSNKDSDTFTDNHSAEYNFLQELNLGIKMYQHARAKSVARIFNWLRFSWSNVIKRSYFKKVQMAVKWWLLERTFLIHLWKTMQVISNNLKLIIIGLDKDYTADIFN